jgi:hypothetical protein
MSLGFFSAKFPMEMKAAKFCFDVYFAFFRCEILYAKHVDLLDKLKEVKKSQFFRLCRIFMQFIAFWCLPYKYIGSGVPTSNDFFQTLFKIVEEKFPSSVNCKIEF